MKKQMTQKSKHKIPNKNNGITLIALVITIVVMLILAAVTISMAVNGGLFDYAEKAVGDTQNAINTEQQFINDIIDEYIKPNLPENEPPKEEVETIPTTTSYVGCYADFNGDGTPEGIIYADLAHTVSGRWNNRDWGDYAYTEESGLKSYYIKEENYIEGDFDNNDENDKIAMIAPVNGTTGKDRFYVMALEDIEAATIDETDYDRFYWYYNAYLKLDRPVATDYNDFGEGKSNTIDMLNDWNNNTNTYGAHNAKDLWGVIQDSEIIKKYPLVTSENDSKKWFVPSKSEWNAFGDYLYTKLGVSTLNFGTYGLCGYYWSSSQYSTGDAYFANFNGGYVNNIGVFSNEYVRLSATF